MDPLRFYREAWAVDFEFAAPPGHRPRPLCLVARELRSKQLVPPRARSTPSRLAIAFRLSVSRGNPSCLHTTSSLTI